MRPLLAASLGLLLVISALPAEAQPFPKTTQATKDVVKDVLQDTDESGAKMLRTAKKMVRKLHDALPAVPIPDIPSTEQGALEIRTSLVQPGVKGIDMTMGAMWVGASKAYWTGVYWIEGGEAGQAVPRAIDISENGVIMFVDAGSLATGSSVNITYHFLGLDGAHIVHALGEIPILDSMPQLDRVDLGGAHASSGETPDVVFLTPWNLYTHNVTAGITIYADDEVLSDETLTACADWEIYEIEPGCRILYVLPFPQSATSLEIWSLDADGARVVERELSRLDLLLGVTFAE